MADATPPIVNLIPESSFETIDPVPQEESAELDVVGLIEFLQRSLEAERLEKEFYLKAFLDLVQKDGLTEHKIGEPPSLKDFKSIRGIRLPSAQIRAARQKILARRESLGKQAEKE